MRACVCVCVCVVVVVVVVVAFGGWLTVLLCLGCFLL